MGDGYIRKAKEMLFTGDVMTAEKAHAIGMVNHVVSLLFHHFQADNVDSDPPGVNPRGIPGFASRPRMKRVFAIDMEACPKYGGKLRVIACIENPDIIATILEHIRARDET